MVVGKLKAMLAKELEHDKSPIPSSHGGVLQRRRTPSRATSCQRVDRLATNFMNVQTTSCNIATLVKGVLTFEANPRKSSIARDQLKKNCPSWKQS